MKKFFTVLLCLVAFIIIQVVSLIAIVYIISLFSKSFLGNLALIVFSPEGTTSTNWLVLFPVIVSTLCGYGISRFLSDKILSDLSANKVVAIIVTVFYSIVLIINIIGIFTAGTTAVTIISNIIVIGFSVANIKDS